MKIQCSLCKEEIEISQSERAKHGLKLFEEHRAQCVKKLMQRCTNPVPNKFDMQGIIGYLHKEMGRIPSEGDVLRFNMLLETKPTEKECKDFVALLKRVNR